MDFEVRRLDQYPTEELEELLIMVDAGNLSLSAFSKDNSRILIAELWLIRIQEALKNKRKEQ